MALLTGLKAYYKLDEASGNPVDASGNGFTLTNTAVATFSAAKINNGITVNGTTQYATRADVLGTTIGGIITISAWIKVATLPASNAFYSIVDVNGGATTPFILYDIMINNAAGVMQASALRGRSFVANDFVSVNETINTGTWYFICLTYDSTTLTLYWNGSSAGATAFSGNGTTGGTTSSSIGVQSAGGADFFNGTIDEVGVWNRALSAAEITSLYNGGAGLQYPFVLFTPEPNSNRLIGAVNRASTY